MLGEILKVLTVATILATGNMNHKGFYKAMLVAHTSGPWLTWWSSTSYDTKDMVLNSAQPCLKKCSF